MKKQYYTLFLLAFIQTSFAQQQMADSGTFLLHKFQKNIGKEKYTAYNNDGVISYEVDFKYLDRGSPVSLKASMQLTPALEPILFRIKGGTSRFSAVNDSVVIHNKTAYIKVDDSSFSKLLKPASFTIAGYSPATAQMLLVQYWKKHNRPQLINMLPSGSVQIKKDGNDTISFNNNDVVLERYVIKGLIWGNELLWTDARGKLYCLITNDAEGDRRQICYRY